MDHFLVDYENIGEAGLKGIENLGSDTSTVIFYSDHADKISFDMHQILSRCRSRLEFRKAETGKKNALDFQLSTYLGYLVASHPGDRFFIISKDNGYRVVMDFWNRSSIQQLDYIGRAYERPARAAAAQAPSRQPVTAPEKKPETAAPANSGEAAGKTPETDKKTPEANKKIQNEAARAPETDKKSTEPMQKTPEITERTSLVTVKTPEIPDKEPGTKEPPKPEEKTSYRQGEARDSAAVREGASVEPEKRTHRGGRKRSSTPRETPIEEKPSEELMNELAQLIDSEEERENIGRFIVKYKTKQGVNNAIVKIYGTEKAGELYKKIKPLLKDKKGK